MVGQNTTEAGTAKAALITGHSAKQWLGRSAKSWFVVAAIGQGIFTLYIMGLYGLSALTGDWERWSTAMPHGIISGDGMGNVAIGIHLALAAVVSVGGPLQIIPQVRQRFPRFHRYNGRVYIFAAFAIALTGIFLITTRGTVGSVLSQVSTCINGVLLMAFAIPTVRFARKKNLAVHQRWAMRLFMVMSGVWFFRVGLMFWLMIWGRPVGFDAETFTGPFLIFLGFGQYLLPLALLETYWWVKKKGGVATQWGFSAVLFLCALVTAIGVFAASMGMWFPNM